MLQNMELMKRLPLSQELLEYYRKRLQSAEEEKLSIIESLKACEVKHSDMHQLQWMLSEREEEILALQRAVKDQELLLFEQQEQILELRAENHQLRMQEMEDRRRIQQLLSLTKPITQEVTFMRDSRPTKLTAALSGRPTDGVAQNGSSSANSSTVEIVCPGSSALPKETPRQNVSESRIPSTGDATPRFATRMLRTVYLPSEKSDSMLLTIDALRRELEEYKRAGEAKVSAVMEQREQVLAESKAQTERLLAQTRELQERTTTLSTLLRNNEREYLLLRHNTSVHERLMKEDNEALKAQNEQLLADHDQHKDRAEHDMQEHATHMARQTENYVKTFRAHAHDHMKEKDNLEEMLVTNAILGTCLRQSAVARRVGP
eukprot:COSAG05_NODE_3580_length_1981_cov_1.397450_1_plen_376_part_00